MRYLKLFNESIDSLIDKIIGNNNNNETIFEISHDDFIKSMNLIESEEITKKEFDEVSILIHEVSKGKPKYKPRVDFFSFDDIRSISIGQRMTGIGKFEKINSTIEIPFRPNGAMIFYKCKDEWWICTHYPTNIPGLGHVAHHMIGEPIKFYLIDSFNEVRNFILNLQ